MKKLFVLLGLALLSLGYAQKQVCEEGFRLFDHEYLATDPVCIPENPQRIAALERRALSTLLDIEIVPMIAGEDGLSTERSGPYAIPEIENVGFREEINLERVLELDPDLILVYGGYEIVDELSAIAPTVAWTDALYEENPFTEWGRIIAEAVNEIEAYEAVAADYEQRTATFQEILGAPEDFTVSIIRPLPGVYRIVHSNLPAVTVLEDAGLSLPDAVTELEDSGYVEVSLERLDIADADVTLVWSTGNDEEERQALLAEYLDDPVFQLLSAAQAGEVYPIGGYWIGQGYREAHLMLDDLFRYVTKVDPQEVSPNPFK